MSLYVYTTTVEVLQESSAGPGRNGTILPLDVEKLGWLASWIIPTQKGALLFDEERIARMYLGFDVRMCSLCSTWYAPPHHTKIRLPLALHRA